MMRRTEERCRNIGARILILSVIFLLMASLLVPAAEARSFMVYNTSAPSQAYFIVNGTTGNSGIGLMNPAYPLDVSGAGRFSGNLYLGTSGRYVYDTGSIIGVSSGLSLGGNLNLGGNNLTNYNYIVANDSSKLNGQAAPYYLDTSSTAQTKSGSLTVTGTWLNATNLNVSTNGYFGGNVGIGTVGPAAKLEIVGVSTDDKTLKIRYDPTLTDYYAYLAHAGNAGYISGLGGLQIVTQSAVSGEGGGNIVFGKKIGAAAATAQMVIKENGNVGIGTTGPNSRLHVANDVSTGISGAFGGNGQKFMWIFGNDNDKVALGTNATSIEFRTGSNSDGTRGTTHMSIQSSGNVGIGTIAPNDKLEVNGNIRMPATEKWIDIYNDSSNRMYRLGVPIGAPTTGMLLMDSGASGFTINKGGDGALSASALYVKNSNGNVGIGTANPSYPLDVNGNIMGRGKITSKSLIANGGSAVSLGININAGATGATYLILVSDNYGAGASTQSAVYIVRAGYDGNNYGTYYVGGSGDIVTFSQSGGILYASVGMSGYNVQYGIFTNKEQ